MALFAVPESARAPQSMRALVFGLATVFLIRGHGQSGCFLPGKTPRSQLSALSTVSSPTAPTAKDLCAEAATSFTYDLLVKDFPDVLASGELHGQPMRREDLQLRLKAIQSSLQISWPEVLGLVSTDIRVTLASSKPQQLSQVLSKLSSELGDREAAIDVIKDYPLVLFSSPEELKGTRDRLRIYALASKVLRPINKVLGVKSSEPPGSFAASTFVA
eukprot:TRINITY_DN72587_c0_g1_i1.p1 TRINITY_DN72587_c0_g1~~TRINITY_DN72587_c0_g1_i1.p1  ORF type:complete len:217 (-),score=32.68 TRINITY_DN72587_c0_g1_i1:39-689(-)